MSLHARIASIGFSIVVMISYRFVWEKIPTLDSSDDFETSRTGAFDVFNI